MAGDFIWYELMTPDPEAAAEFYGAVIGWTVSPHADPAAGGMDYRIILRADGSAAGGVLRLSQEMLDHGARSCWLGYVEVDDVDAAVAAMTADGATVQMPATDLPVGRMAMVADPQGAPFYVMKPIPPAGQPDAQSAVFSVDRPQHIRWNQLSTSDQDAAIAFYCKHFGWTQEGAMPMGPLGEYKFIQHGGTGIGAVMRKVPELPASMWTYYVGVDDIDRAVEAVKVQGGKVIMGPDQIPGGEYSVVGIDRLGASFGLVGPRNAG